MTGWAWLTIGAVVLGVVIMQIAARWGTDINEAETYDD